MVLASGMRRAGERNLLVAQTQPIGGAALDERQGLQRLDGGARIDRPVRVAKGHNHPAVGIDDRAGPAVGGFDPFSARGLDDHRIGHGLLSRREDKAPVIRSQPERPARANVDPDAHFPVCGDLPIA